MIKRLSYGLIQSASKGITSSWQKGTDASFVKFHKWIERWGVTYVTEQRARDGGIAEKAGTPGGLQRRLGFWIGCKCNHKIKWYGSVRVESSDLPSPEILWPALLGTESCMCCVVKYSRKLYEIPKSSFSKSTQGRVSVSPSKELFKTSFSPVIATNRFTRSHSASNDGYTNA